MPLQITSPQNTRIKNVVKLNNRRHRETQQRTVVEGAREIAQALQAGILPLEIYVCPPIVRSDEAATAVCTQLYQLAEQYPKPLFEVTPELFKKMAYRGRSGGMLIVIPYLQRPLDQLPLPERPLLVVIEGSEKPGNVGAILRTADAAGVDGLILSANETRHGTDLHNPNVVRASLGALFTVPVAVAPTRATIHWLRRQGIQIAVTIPERATPYTAVDMTGPIALVMGSEAYGLSEAWLAAADRRLYIPMSGRVDSLNLSVSAALVMYEAVRQRLNGVETAV